METNGKRNETYLRKRKMLLVLPVILIPMITLGFYGLGGGKGDKGGNGIGINKGLNMSLPAARSDSKRKGLSKLEFYKQSEQDSLKLRASRKMDPYYGQRDSAAPWVKGVGEAGGHAGVSGRGIGGLTLEPAPTDAQARELLEKLDRLKGVLSKQEQLTVPGRSFPEQTDGRAAYSGRLPPGMVSPPFVAGAGRMVPGDPDLDKLNLLMDKVLKVRNPADASLRVPEEPADTERPVATLTVAPPEQVMRSLPVETLADDLETGFIDLDQGKRSDSLPETMIEAVVDGAQTLLSGEAVVLRIAGME